MTVSGLTRREGRSIWRLRLGAIVFGVSFCSPFVLVPLVVASNLPSTWKTTLSSFFAVGLPEVGMFAAVAVMGKPGFEVVKRRWVAPIRRFLSPEQVSRTRYHIGLGMFCLPLLSAWLGPYLELAFGLHVGWGWHASLDVMFIASVLVLGGEFWDKARALFRYDANVGARS
jgi:hypothetical protein